ncbi:LysR family transcriptional regulator [Bdellovibrio sp. SKB1291214]|uniref:LysR family transcriptional regulator n=1 Tax=Bdellovibrio sp. SKB1291214 TaxID=1732569 RepID=UPI00223FCB53|nr:LysR family transcriptional regulator [Bdellovibrio sp. SKB1291214]UYL07843.1 LysR family transcriptional regulator [Bdellovibrio sp. SKB1291214]
MKKPLDLNLLVVVESLYRTLNVSKTAQELSVTQSAISHGLKKLREHFNDPLFVRASKGMTLTETAKRLRPQIEDLVHKALNLSLENEKFDPLKISDRITIATSDYIEILVMPAILKRLKTEAPHLQISIRPTRGDFPKTELESGVFDMAIAGFYKNLPEGFYETKVLEDTFSTAYRKKHPLIQGEIKPAQYSELEHALITLQGDFKDDLTKKAGEKRKPRKIVFGSYSFTGLAFTLSQSDLVLTAPTLLLNKYAEYFPIQVQPSPYPMPAINMRMVWHSRTHKDPLRLWFRNVIKSELAKISRTS